MEKEKLLKKYEMLISILKLNIRSLKTATEEANKKAFRMKISVVILSTSITLLLGLELKFFTIGPQIALFVSCVITILTAMDQFLGITSNHKVLGYRLHLVTLLCLDLELHVNGDAELSEEKWLEFKKRFDQIIEESYKASTEQPSEQQIND